MKSITSSRNSLFSKNAVLKLSDSAQILIPFWKILSWKYFRAILRSILAYFFSDPSTEIKRNIPSTVAQTGKFIFHSGIQNVSGEHLMV